MKDLYMKQNTSIPQVILSTYKYLFVLASLNILDIYLAPLNRNTGQPWKTMSNNKTSNYLMKSYTNCSDKVDEQLKKCLETIAYSNEETVLKTNHRGNNKTQFSFGLYQA